MMTARVGPTRTRRRPGGRSHRPAEQRQRPRRRRQTTPGLRRDTNWEMSSSRALHRTILSDDDLPSASVFESGGGGGAAGAGGGGVGAVAGGAGLVGAAAAWKQSTATGHASVHEERHESRQQRGHTSGRGAGFSSFRLGPQPMHKPCCRQDHGQENGNSLGEARREKNKFDNRKGQMSRPLKKTWTTSLNSLSIVSLRLCCCVRPAASARATASERGSELGSPLVAAAPLRPTRWRRRSTWKTRRWCASRWT